MSPPDYFFKVGDKVVFRFTGTERRGVVTGYSPGSSINGYKIKSGGATFIVKEENVDADLNGVETMVSLL